MKPNFHQAISITIQISTFYRFFSDLLKSLLILKSLSSAISTRRFQHRFNKCFRTWVFLHAGTWVFLQSSTLNAIFRTEFWTAAEKSVHVEMEKNLKKVDIWICVEIWIGICWWKLLNNTDFNKNSVDIEIVVEVAVEIAWWKCALTPRV